MRVLVVEDSDDASLLLRVTLESNGHEVAEASDGAVALRAVESWRPDLVVLDVMLPGMDGLAITRKIREGATPDVPIVLLTGRRRSEDEEEGWQAGADLYLMKPCSPVSILEAVERLGDTPAIQLRTERSERARTFGSVRRRLATEQADKDLSDRIRRLSDRELDVARLAAAGVQVEEGCRLLGLAEGTWWAHKRAIRRKLAVPRGKPLEPFLRLHLPAHATPGRG